MHHSTKGNDRSPSKIFNMNRTLRFKNDKNISFPGVFRFSGKRVHSLASTTRL